MTTRMEYPSQSRLPREPSRTIPFGLLLALLLCASVATAGTVPDVGELQAQRKNFQAAEQALERGDRARFRELKEQIQGYVLYPYLEYWELMRYLSRAKSNEIEIFFETYSDTPMADRLRAAWLRQLARRDQWDEYLKAYTTSQSAPARCRALLAMIKTGRTAEAMAAVEPLWLVGKSQPRACDPLFNEWQKAGYLSKNLAWKRIKLAMQSHRPSLARYLARFLDPSDQTWVDLWRKIHQDPESIVDRQLFKATHPMREDILVHGLQRLSRRDVGKAARAWKRIKKHYPFTEEQRASAQRAVALRMARENHPLAAQALEALPEAAEDDQVRQWRIRSALAGGQWEQVLHWIERLPEEAQSSEQWRYWRARSLEQLGETSEARKSFAGLSLSRSYYGFLAADQLDVEYHILHNPLPGSDGELAALLRVPGIRRAYELLQLDHLTDARREWHHATSGMGKTQLQRAAKLAHSWGWHDRAIFTVARAKYWDDLIARFPLAYREPVEQEASLQGLDSAWVFAMLRQESAFVTDARSPAGALGLMQLMPRTARQIARQLKTNLRNDHDLLSADVNIKLGTAYLRSVFDDLGNNQVLATAAYNAGPSRVKSWLPTNGAMPADLWIETVPFGETRDYLRRVLAYTVIYEQRLGLKPTRLQKRMLPIAGSTVMTRAAEQVGDHDTAS